MEEEERQKRHVEWRWRRAPSTVCLVCASCRRRVTPCLNCAHLLPFCPSLSWHTCPSCKLRNSFVEQERRILGFPPALALPTSMARRVLIAHVGRSACAISIHMQIKWLQQLLAQENDERFVGRKDEVSGKLLDGKDKTYSNSGVTLPFLQCEGLIDGTQATDAPLSSGVTFENHESLTYTGCLCMVAKVNDAKDNQGQVDNCHACGGKCQHVCPKASLVNDAVLARCREQLTALECVETITMDTNSPSYPLSKTVWRLTSSIAETKTCHAKLSHALAGGLSFGILRLVSSLLAPVFEAWLMAEKLVERDGNVCIEDILATAENFLHTRDTLLHLQRSLLQSAVAQDQSAKDCLVIGQGQPLYPVGCWLTQTLAHRALQRKQAFMRVAEPFQNLLDRINVVLQFLSARAHLLAVCQQPTTICTGLSDEHPTKTVQDEVRGSMEAVRVSASCWLLLYHDVAQAIRVS